MEPTIVSLMTAYQLHGCKNATFTTSTHTCSTMTTDEDNIAGIRFPGAPSSTGSIPSNDSILSSQYHPNTCTNPIYLIPPDTNNIPYVEDLNVIQNYTNTIGVMFYLLVAIVTCIASYLFYAKMLNMFARETTTQNAKCSREKPVAPTIVQEKPLLINNIQIILDYDDTIFPTEYTQNNINEGCSLTKNEWDLLCALNRTVYETLLMFIELFGASNICIVSNAKLSWMNESCWFYGGLYQNIRNLILLNQIRVISATDSYHSQKSKAFMSVLRKKHNINKVVSIGDGLQEYDDIDTVCSVLKGRRRRKKIGSMNYCRFKLSDKPSLNRMVQQLQSLQRMDFVVIAQNRYDESYVI